MAKPRLTPVQQKEYDKLKAGKGQTAAEAWANGTGVKNWQSNQDKIATKNKPVVIDHSHDANPDGTVNWNPAVKSIIDQSNSDYRNQFNANNPDQVSAGGDTLHYEMGADGKVKVTTTNGQLRTDLMNQINSASGSYKPIDPNAGPHILTGDDLAAQKKTDYDAVYGNETQYLGQQRTADLEAKKQELAQRGIVYDPNAEDPNSQTGYGKAIQGVLRGYDQKYHTAANDAQVTSDTNAANQISASGDAYQRWLSGQTAANDETRGHIADLRTQYDQTNPNFAPFQGGGTLDNTSKALSLLQLLQSGKASQRDYDLGIAKLKEQGKVDDAQINDANRKFGLAASKSHGSGSKAAKPKASPGGFQVD